MRASSRLVFQSTKFPPTNELFQNMLGFPVEWLVDWFQRDLDFKVQVKFHGEICDIDEENVYTMH